MTSPEAAAEIERPAPRAWLVTASALALYLVGTQIPLPGLEPASLAARGSSQGGVLGLVGYHPPLVAVLGVGLGWLVLVRGALALWLGGDGDASGRPSAARWRLVGLGVFLLASGGQALVLLRYLEQAVGPNGVPLLGDVGWAYRLSAFATLVGGASVLWVLATWISREGVGHGTLLLLATTSLVGGADGLFVVGQQLGSGGGQWGLGLGAFLSTLPISLAALVLWRSEPEKWPVTVPPLRPTLRTLDVLCAPAALSAVIAMPALAVAWLLWAVTPASLAGLARLQYWLGVAQPLTTLALVGALGWWWRRGVQGSRRRAAWLAVVVGAPILGAGLIVAGLAAAGGINRPLGPSAYAGEATFEIVLESPQGGGEHDAKVLLARLDELGVRAELLEATEDRMVLRLIGVSDEAAVLSAAFPQGRLAFHLVARDQGPLAPRPGEDPPRGLLVDDERGVDVFLGPSPESLVAILDRAPPTAGRLARIECRPDTIGRQWPAPPRASPSPPRDRRECLVRLLEDPPVLSGEDVVDASVTQDDATGRPMVSLGFSPQAGERFAQITAASVGRLLAIVLDERIESAPLIQGPIAGGRAVITLGSSAPNDPQQLRQAASLVAALRHGALQGRWTKTAVRRVD